MSDRVAELHGMIGDRLNKAALIIIADSLETIAKALPPALDALGDGGPKKHRCPLCGTKTVSCKGSLHDWVRCSKCEVIMKEPTSLPPTSIDPAKVRETSNVMYATANMKCMKGEYLFSPTVRNTFKICAADLTALLDTAGEQEPVMSLAGLGDLIDEVFNNYVFKQNTSDGSEKRHKVFVDTERLYKAIWTYLPPPANATEPDETE